MGIAVAPDGKRVYVSTGRGKSVVVIDMDRDEVCGTIPDVGARPWGICITPDGRTLYTANGPSNDVSAIDVAEMKVTARIPAGDSPWGLSLAR